MAPYHVVGAGGIGCAVGYGLLAAGLPIVFVETNPEKITWGRRHGVSIDCRPALPAEFISFDDWKVPPQAVVLLCTKCYDNIPVLSRLPPDVTLPMIGTVNSGLFGIGNAVVHHRMVVGSSAIRWRPS